MIKTRFHLLGKFASFDLGVVVLQYFQNIQNAFSVSDFDPVNSKGHMERRGPWTELRG